MKLPRGTSLFWRKEKKRWVLAHLTETGWKQKVIEPRFGSKMRSEAGAWAIQWLQSNGLNTEALLARRAEDGPTMAEFVEKWFSLREADDTCAPSTLKGNREHMALRILPKFGSIPFVALPDQLTEIRDWVVAMKATASVVTVRNTYFTFKAFFRDAMAEDWIKTSDNLLAHPKIVKALPSLDDREGADPVALPVAMVQALIDCAAAPLDRRVRYVVGFTTGERDGEIAGLRWADVDIDVPDTRVRITKAVAIVGAKGKGGYAKERRPKTRSSVRTLPLHAAAVAALRDWRAYAWAAMGGAPPAEHYVFPGTDGQAARPKSAAHMRKDLRAAGLPESVNSKPVLFKCTRSSFGTWLHDAEVPEATRKRLMGHSIRDVTQKHYTAKDVEAMRRAVAVIPLVWNGVAGIGTVPAIVPPGTAGADIDLESLAPSAEVESATNGLGKGKRARSRSARRARPGTKKASDEPPSSGLPPGRGSRGSVRGRSGTMPDAPTSTVVPDSAWEGLGLSELTGLRGFAAGLAAPGPWSLLESAELAGEAWS